jgi:hypothetical protein
MPKLRSKHVSELETCMGWGCDLVILAKVEGDMGYAGVSDICRVIFGFSSEFQF